MFARWKKKKNMPARPETIDLSLSYDRPISHAGFLAPIIDLIGVSLPGFIPTEMYSNDEDEGPFSRDRMDSLFLKRRRATANTSDGCFFAGRSDPSFQFFALWSDPLANGLDLIHAEFGMKSIREANAIPVVRQVFRSLCERTSPAYGYACLWSEYEKKNMYRVYNERLRAWANRYYGGPPRSLVDLLWLNFFGRPYVEFFGNERLRAAPVSIVEEIGEGVLLGLCEEPSDALTDGVLGVAAAVREHLGVDAFVDRANPTRPMRVPKFGQ
jgi:hypothetical protein